MKAIVQDRYGSADVLELRDIDRTYPLSEAPEAVRHLAQGHATGKVVIVV